MGDRSDGTRRGRSEREILVGGLTTFLFMTAIGLASNTLLLLVGFLVSVPMNVTGYTDGKTQVLWLIFAVISELFCMIFGFWFERFVGHNAAEYRFANNQPHSTDGLSMILTVGSGVLLHGALTAAVAVNLLQALFFAGPVQYWARVTDTGVGMHDLARGAYGGNIYLYDGSHGCINMSLSAAAEMYELTYEYMPIAIHE